MKKALLFVVSGVAVIAAVMLFRAATIYQDVQIKIETPLARVSLDESALVQRFSEAIQIPTVSYDDRSNFSGEEILRFHGFLARKFPLIHGFATLEKINEYSLVYEFPGSSPDLRPVLFMGHMDVVPVDEDTRDEWQQPPFSGAVVDGEVWGRGAIDDKATVMALMEAMEHLLSDGKRPKRTLFFSFGHDEEVGGTDGAAKVAEYFADRGTSFEWVLDEGGAVTEGIVPGLNQPVALIGVAEKGFLNIRLLVEVPGGHSSTPPEHTGAGILAAAIVRLEDNLFAANTDFTDMTFDATGYYAPFVQRLAMANRWLFDPLVVRAILANPRSAASIRTTTAVTMLQGSVKANILPTNANAVVNFRILPGQTTDNVVTRVTEIVDDPRVKLTPFSANNPSPISSLDSPAYNMFARLIREIAPDTLVAPYLVQGGTDSRYFYDLADDVYRFLMFRATQETMVRIHGLNERLAVADYLTAVQYFHELLQRAAY